MLKLELKKLKMHMILLVSFLSAFLVSLFLTFVIRSAMRRFSIVDFPVVGSRKIHNERIPLGGGLAIFASFFIIILFFWFFSARLGPTVTGKHLLGLFLGGLILMIGGLLDDKYCLKVRYQIIFPIIASLVAIASGITVQIVSSPLNGAFSLENFFISFGSIGNIVLFADLFAFLWLMSMMYTTKLLDGLDGLVTGIVLIGSLIIFFLSLQPRWYQPDISLVSIIFAGSCFGFLIWNWHKAKIFLGEGGSLFAGFALATLAVISEGKIAITALVMCMPILDMVRVVSNRILNKKSVFAGDSEHLHFRLLQSGLSHTQTVLLFYSISFLFGVTALFLQNKEKVIALIFLFLLMLLVGLWCGKKK
jgi:UDP-GlcNAc:undecaprenyl-phosphate GlcNAc-1-phosphate transferase